MSAAHTRPVAILTVLVCAFYTPQLLSGTVQFDGVDVHYSAQRFLSDELHAGRLPFWTAYVFSGFPFLADLQVGAWYPLNWPFFLAGITPSSISGELLLHTWIACVGTYALGVRWLGARSAAVGAGLFYGLSGFFAAHSQHVGIFETAAWLPWLVLLLDAMRERVTVRRLAIGSLVGAALALPGHFQTALYAVSGAAVWALLEVALSRSRWVPTRRVVGGVLAVGLWGGLIAAVMILPAAELVAQSVRAQFNARDVNLGYFHPEALLTLVQPDHYGLLSGHYGGPGDSTQHYFYASVLLLPLAVLGAGNRRVGRAAALLGLPFLWYALGPAGGVYRVVAALPGFRSVELPMHGWFLPALGLALLGGAGLLKVPVRLRVPLLAVAFVDLLVVNQLLLPLAYARGSFAELYDGPLRAFAAQVSAADPPVERVYGPPLSAVGYRNHALQSRVETTYGYNPLELAAYAAYAAAAETNPALVDALAATHRLADVGSSAVPNARDQLQQPGATGPVLEPDSSALPLAAFARHLTVVADEAAARGALADLDPAADTLVVGPLPLDSGVQFDPAATVSIVQRDSAALTLHYRSATAGVLRVAIPAYPGWAASLTGTPLTTLTVDVALLGVVVPAGEGDVHLQFSSRLFWPGALISLVALSMALIALLITRAAIKQRARVLDKGNEG